VHCN